MRLIIITQQDPFYLPLFFEAFFKGWRDGFSDIEIFGVVMQRPLGQRSKRALLRRMVDFYGPTAFLVMSLKYVSLIVANRLSKIGLLPRACSTEYFCRKQGVPILRYTNVNHPKFIDFVKRNKVDLVVSVAASQIFKQEILQTPKLGCINIHNAPLPDYRGMMPNFWQMFYGEKYSVATIHEMVEEIDKGRIIYQQHTPIEKGVTLDALIKRTKRSNASALLHVLRMFQTDEIRYYPLPGRTGSYFSFPSRRDLFEFRRRGYRIL